MKNSCNEYSKTVDIFTPRHVKSLYTVVSACLESFCALMWWFQGQVWLFFDFFECEGKCNGYKPYNPPTHRHKKDPTYVPVRVGEACWIEQGETGENGMHGNTDLRYGSRWTVALSSYTMMCVVIIHEGSQVSHWTWVKGLSVDYVLTQRSTPLCNET